MTIVGLLGKNGLIAPQTITQRLAANLHNRLDIHCRRTNSGRFLGLKIKTVWKQLPYINPFLFDRIYGT
jgi:hypothetical protein